MADIIIILILLAIVCGAVFYIVKSKKSGASCIGCPSAGGCSGSNRHLSCGIKRDILDEEKMDGDITPRERVQ